MDPQARTVLQRVSDFIGGMMVESPLHTPLPEMERGLSTSQMSEQIREQIKDAFRGIVDAEVDPWDGYEYLPVWFYELHIDDDSGIYAIFQANGRIYRAPVTVNGTVADLGMAEEVAVNYVPAMTSSRTIYRNADTGRYEWIRIISTPVILRGSYPEIDSTTLYESFLSKIEDSGELPVASVLHLGAEFRVGESDHVWIDGKALCDHGVFDDTPFARQVAQGLMEHGEEWGTSIMYYPTAPAIRESIGGVEVDVWHDGILMFADFVLERKAAAHFTTSGVKQREIEMKKADREALLALGVSEDELERIESEAGNVTRTIEEQGLIARSADEEDEDTEEGTEEATEAVVEERTVVLSPEALDAIVGSVVESLGIDALTERVNALDGVVEQIERIASSVAQVSQRVQRVERGHKAQAQDEVRKMPARTTIVLPNQQKPVEGAPNNKERTYADIAGDTLKNLAR